jgi:hypothetical protein
MYNRNLFLTVLVLEKSKIKAVAGLMSDEGPYPVPCLFLTWLGD